MNNFKPGDKVKIKDLHLFDEEEDPRIIEEMYKLIGKIFTIKKVNQYVGLDDDDEFLWNKRWLMKID